MKQRVVLVTDSLDPSGMGRHMVTLGEGLAAEFDVALAAPRGDALPGLLGEAARSGLRVKQLDLARMDLFGDWLRGFGAALVHVHAGIGWEGHELARAAKRARLPVVRTEHLPYLLTSPVQQAEYRAMLFSVDRRIAVSAAVAESYTGRAKGRIETVVNGIAPRAAAASRTQTRIALGIAESDPVVLNVARFAPQKGHDVLLEAISAVVRDVPNVRFLLVGDGPEREAVAAQVAVRELTPNVKTLGSRQDVPDLLASANLFVLPSQFEGLPLALLEAMAAGLPVVATAVPGTVEALGDQHALLVPPGDASALARTIISALDDSARTRAATEAAGVRFASRFTAERMARETSSIYRSLLGTLQPQGASA